MEQLSGQDASFVYLETANTPMHIGSVGIYDPSTAPGGKVRSLREDGFVIDLHGHTRFAFPKQETRAGRQADFQQAATDLLE